MIESTFILLKGVGEYTERRLWEDGIGNWRAFLAAQTLPGIAPGRKSLYDEELETARQHLLAGRSRPFARCLKPRDQWRLFDAFRPRTLFLDIETTGTSPEFGEVTVVGLYRGGRMTTLIRGDSLHEARLNEELAACDLLVTFCGSLFDVPYLRTKFPGLILDHPHFDLCFAARRLGLTGGLKRIEAQMGIRRDDDLQGLDGWDAVRLWHEWQGGNEEALDRLLRYNDADTRNLERLAEQFYAQLADRYGPGGGASAAGKKEQPR